MRIMIAVFVAAGLIFVAARLAAYEVKDVLPPDVDVVFELYDPVEFAAGLESCPPGKLWNDEAFQRFIGEVSIVDKLREFVIEGEKDNPGGVEKGALIWRQFAMIRGDFTAALDVVDDKPLFYFIIHEGKDDFEASLELDRRICELDDMSIFATESFDGGDIHHLRHEDEDGRVTSAWLTYAGGYGIQGPDRRWVESVAAKVVKTPPDENENPPSLKLTVRRKLVESWLLGDEAAAPSPTADDGAAENPFNPRMVMKGLGMDQVDSLSLMLRPTGEELLMEFQAAGINELRGIFSMLDIKAAAGDNRLPFVPEDVIAYSASQFNYARFWRELPVVIADINPATALQFHGAVSMAGGMIGTDINQLIEAMDGIVIGYSIARDGRMVKLNTIGFADPEVARQAMAAVFKPDGPLAGFDDMLKSDNFLGHEIHIVQVPPPPVQVSAGSSAPDNRFAIAMVAENLVVGDVELTRSFIRAAAGRGGGARSYYSTRDFRRMSALTPEKNFFHTFIDCGRFIKATRSGMIDAYDGLKDMRDSAQPPPRMAAIDEFIDEFDIEQLPSAERMSRYFSYAVNYLTLKEGKLEFALKIMAADDSGGDR